MTNSACAVSELNDVTTGYKLQRCHSALYVDCKTSEMEGKLNLKTEEKVRSQYCVADGQIK